MAQSLKPSLWPLVTGIYPIPSAGSVYDDLVLFLHAFTPLITFGLICNSFRFACFVDSSLRFLIPNLHPICTCSCLFTPLTEGRSARDLTQAATSQKKRKNPYEEGCYTGEDLEDVKRKWEAKKEYFLQYKKDGSHPPCIDLAMALQGFDIDNTAAYHAIEDSKALHARRWQTKEGIYRIKRQALPDVRDAPLNDDNAAASSTDVKPRWRNWDEDYAKGYQRHP